MIVDDIFRIKSLDKLQFGDQGARLHSSFIILHRNSRILIVVSLIFVLNKVFDTGITKRSDNSDQLKAGRNPSGPGDQ
jgi:hypothetical protein